MTILRNHYVLAVHDLQRTRDWYERVLGCTADDVDPGNWVFLSRDNTTFMCGHCADATSPLEAGDHAYFAYLVVDDVDAWHERAKREGAEILKAPRDEPWAMREMALRTCDGHRMTVGTKLDPSVQGASGTAS